MSNEHTAMPPDAVPQPVRPDQLAPEAAAFWRSVQEGRADLEALDALALMERLNALLEPHLPGVAVEVAEGNDDGPAGPGALLVLTAHGSTEHFAAVQALAAAVPVGLPWRTEAFRHRTGEGFGIRMDGLDLDAADVLARVGHCEGRVALALSFTREIPVAQQERARHMAFIILDHLLGEYDFAVKVGLVEFASDGLSDDAGFESAPALSLTAAVAEVDRVWRETLGRSTLTPPEPHQWHRMEWRRRGGGEAQVSVNTSANSLVGRADLGWRVDARVPAAGKADLKRAQAFEDAWLQRISPHGQGILTHVVLEGGQRTSSCHVADPMGAVAAAHAAASALQGGAQALELEARYEPAWDDYLGWSA